MVGHEFGAGGAVETDAHEPKGVLQVAHAGVERLHPLTGQHGPGGLDGPGDHERHALAALPKGPADSLRRRLQVQGILGRLQEEEVNPAGQEPQGLAMEGGDQLVKGDPPRDRDGPGRRTHGAGHPAGFFRCPYGVAGGAGDLRCPAVDFEDLLHQAVFGQHDVRGAEAVGLDDIGPGLQVGAVNVRDDVGAGQDQLLIAPLVLGPAEVVGGEVAFLELGSHGAVDDEDAVFKGEQ